MDARTSRREFESGGAVTAQTADHKRAGIFRRIFDAFTLSGQRQVERDIRRLIGRSGGHLTDEMERQIGEYLIRKSSFDLSGH
jgi:hypothetical protein